jgi:gluconate 2-dehydrogenase gamma chain
LTAENWQILVLRLAEDKSTEKWLSGMLTTILEALTLDPIYNINNNNFGWDWLEHQTGFPQPTEENKFPNFYNGQDLA